MLKPLFKWAGAKGKMMASYEPHLDFMANKDTLIDCFFGAGGFAVWARNKYPDMNIVAVEYNEEMMTVFETLRDHTDDFIKECLKIEKEYLKLSDEGRYFFYYWKREQYAWNTGLTPVKRAAMLLFLMKTCFNGVWVTRNVTNGKFGTPPGARNEKTVFNEVQLRTFAAFLNSITLISGDFAESSKLITDSSFVYCDPPYRDSHTPYAGGFDDNEQVRLTKFMKFAKDKGAAVAMSNKLGHDDFWDTHLPSWNYETFNVKYTVTRNGSEAKPDVEVLFINR